MANKNQIGTSELPEGFVLENLNQLPEGFTLETPIQRFLQPLQQPANIVLQAMQMLPGAREYLNLEQQQAQQRQIIQNVLLNKLGGRFPVARGITAESLNYITPSNIIASGVGSYLGGQGLGKMAQIPATRRFLQLRTPTLSKGLLKANPIESQYKNIGGRLQDIIKPLSPETYASKKTLAIREQAKLYHNKEVNVYGDMLNNLAKTGKEKIDVSPALEKMTMMMKERGLISPEGNWLTPLNKVDRQLLNSYNSLLRQIQTNGSNKLSVSDIMQEIINIKNSGGSFKEPTTFGRMALDTQAEILSAIKPQIKSNIFRQGNQRYTIFKQNMEALDRYFNIWGNPLETGMGERFLMRQLGTSGQARNVANIVKQNLGQSLKGAQVASRLYRIQRNPLIRYGLLGGGLYGLGKALSGQNR